MKLDSFFFSLLRGLSRERNLLSHSISLCALPQLILMPNWVVALPADQSHLSRKCEQQLNATKNKSSISRHARSNHGFVASPFFLSFIFSSRYSWITNPKILLRLSISLFWLFILFYVCSHTIIFVYLFKLSFCSFHVIKGYFSCPVNKKYFCDGKINCRLLEELQYYIINFSIILK